MRTRRFMSPINAVLEIEGKAVGYLQSVSIDQDFDLKAIPSLRTPRMLGYIAGVETVNFTISKGFIDLDELLFNDSLLNKCFGILSRLDGRLTRYAKYTKAVVSETINSVATATLPHYKSSIQQTSSLDPITKAEYKDVAIRNLSANPAGMARFMANIDFDMAIMGPASRFTNVLSQALQNFPAVTQVPGVGTLSPASLNETVVEVFKLTGCRVRTRRISMSISNIMVMEDMVGVATDMRDSYFDQRKPEFPNLLK